MARSVRSPEDPAAFLGEDAIAVESVAKGYHGLAQKLLEAPTPLLTRAFKGARPTGIDEPEEEDEEGEELIEEEEEETPAIPTASNVDLLWALRDVSFRAKPGEAIALVGRPGSGKTTLLQILAGVVTPSTGQVVLRGRPSPLVAHTVQFSLATQSPRRNASFMAAFAGIPRRRLRKKLPAIFEFAEMDRDEQRATVTMRPLVLALALTLNIDTEVVLLDDPFAWTPAALRQRCIERTRELRDAGKTIVLETRDREAMLEVCTRALWLDRGQVVGDGPVEQILQAFDEAEARARSAGPSADGVQARSFDARAALVGVRCDASGDGVRVSIELETNRGELAAQLGVGFAAADGHGFWFEQPESTAIVQAGVHRFELAVSELPPGSYRGRVEARIAEASLEPTVLGRIDAFYVGDEPAEPAPEHVDWEPRAGSWRVVS